MQGTVIQINVSRGGVPKYAIPEGEITSLGLTGDGHAHPQIHGGPLQALLLISAEDIDALRADGWPVFYGALGENITTGGIDFRQVRAGQRFRLGDAIIRTTKVRSPCDTLSVYGGGIQKVIYDARVKGGDTNSPLWGVSGFYAAVERGATIRVGDILKLLDQVV